MFVYYFYETLRNLFFFTAINRDFWVLILIRVDDDKHIEVRGIVRQFTLTPWQGRSLTCIRCTGLDSHSITQLENPYFPRSCVYRLRVAVSENIKTLNKEHGIIYLYLIMSLESKFEH